MACYGIDCMQCVVGAWVTLMCPVCGGASRNLTTAVLEAHATQLLDQSLARDSENARGARLVAGGQSQHLGDVIRLELRQRGSEDRRIAGGSGAAGQLGGQVLEPQLLG